MKDQALRCSVCGEMTRYRGVIGSRCERCGYQTDDFSGATTQTHEQREAMLERERQRVYAQQGPRPVHVVYYLRFGDRIKIGTSQQLENRLNSLPFDEVLAIERGGSALEAQRHREWRLIRIKGEWFQATPELVEHARSLLPNGVDWRTQLRRWRLPNAS